MPQVVKSCSSCGAAWKGQPERLDLNSHSVKANTNRSRRLRRGCGLNTCRFNDQCHGLPASVPLPKRICKRPSLSARRHRLFLGSRPCRTLAGRIPSLRSGERPKRVRRSRPQGDDHRYREDQPVFTPRSTGLSLRKITGTSYRRSPAFRICCLTSRCSAAGRTKTSRARTWTRTWTLTTSRTACCTAG